MANPCDHDYINNQHFGDGLITGFYGDLPAENIHNINIDDVADFAQADVDLISDHNIADYGAAELGINDIANDLQINEFVADAQENPSDNIDFNAFNDDYHAVSVSVTDYDGNNHHNDVGHNDYKGGNDYGSGNDYGGGNNNGGGCGGGTIIIKNKFKRKSFKI